MNFRTVMSVFSALAVIGGLCCMILPAAMVGSFGVTLSPMGLVIYQFWGASLFGIGALAFVLRAVGEPAMQRSLARVLALVNALNIVMAVLGQFNGASVWGWSNVVLFALFAVVFAVLALGRKAAPAAG